MEVCIFQTLDHRLSCELTKRRPLVSTRTTQLMVNTSNLFINNEVSGVNDVFGKYSIGYNSIFSIFTWLIIIFQINLRVPLGE